MAGPGFDHSVLSGFRDPLVTDRAPRRLLDLILGRLREVSLLVRPSGQRTDSTHVLAAVRRLNRLENTAEHLRAAPNALAAAAPDWLSTLSNAEAPCQHLPGGGLNDRHVSQPL
ncbi:hypothetical protein [Streptomyces sp. NBC_01236]|uniref:hypothetical protein n=1 Tax=Streptomyces sp. NBC_01236 TaxID=2903789 RepID=UPI002E14C838|nr:hypothetical protein OG324_41475 [Streptomyces sp. NBC_01236]